jgi:hypothetical protein
MLRQTPEDRQRRLDRGGCPLHGTRMYALADADIDEAGTIFVIVGCECGTLAWFFPELGTFEIASQFGHLISAGRA